MLDLSSVALAKEDVGRSATAALVGNRGLIKNSIGYARYITSTLRLWPLDSRGDKGDFYFMTAADRITRNPAIMGGKPCIRNLRVTVGTIAGLVAAGKTRDEILKLYPYLEPDDITAALTYAAWRTEEQEIELHHG